MDISTIKNMDESKYVDILVTLLYDDPDFILNVCKGHATDFHAGMTDKEMLLRMINEEKKSVTSFTDKETMLSAIQEFIDYNAEDIASWIQSSYKDVENKSDYGEYAASLDLKRGALGKGYEVKKDGFYNKETPYIRVVLERDSSGESPMGFYVKTAYPDIMVSKEREKVDIDKVIKEIKDFDPIEKLYLKAREDGLRCSMQTSNGQKQLRVVIKIDDDKRAVAYYTKNDYSYRLKHADGKSQKIKSSDLLNIDKDLLILLKLETLKRNIMQDDSIKPEQAKQQER